MNKPFKLLPYFKSTIWGGKKIPAFKGLSVNCHNVGESWELSAVDGCESIVADGDDVGMTLSALVKKYGTALVGKSVYERYGGVFPLLIKFIDAGSDLSLQVHPDDKLAKERHNSFGKTEMWYIIAAEPEARIHTGLVREITPDEYDRRVGEGSLMDVVGSYSSRPGDVYFLPAGRLHAIGAGNFLVEVQQSSDITYRVDDYGRKDSNGKCRELHTQQAREAIDYHYYLDCKSEPCALSVESSRLVQCPYFDVKLEHVGGCRNIQNPDDSFMGVVCLSGKGTIRVGGVAEAVRQGDTVLVPADAQAFEAEGEMTLLTAVCR